MTGPSQLKGVRGLVAVVGAFTMFAVACSSDDSSGGDSTEVDATAEPTTNSVTTDAVVATDAAVSSDAVTTDGAPSSNAPASGPVPATGQGIDDETILIGVSMDESGPFGPVTAEALAALGARFDVANAAGGVNGRQIEMIILDDKGDATQALDNFRQLWKRDKVFAIYTLGANIPLEYIAQNEIPTFGAAGPSALFSSAYPTVMPIGGLIPTWAGQTAYALVEYGGIAPKKVAVLYDPVNEALNDFVENYWMELGAEEVIFDPPPADCSALVLKYKDAGVDYWDWQHISWFQCLQAEKDLGWEPPMGQGGAIASQIALARLFVDDMPGIIAGSPARLADGRPTYDSPPEAHQAYLDGVAEYAPELYADTGALNGTIPMLIWVGGSFIIDAIEGAAVESGEISQGSMLEWAWAVEDWDTGIAGVLHSVAPDCKTGNDQSIWGPWMEDPSPGGDILLDPITPDMIDNSWLGVDKCYLTQLADEING